VHARSFKQKLTAISSTDAEIIAACTAISTAVWLRNLHNEIHTALGSAIESVVFHQDNKSAIWLTTEPTRYRRSRHILIKIAYIREHCILRVVLTSYLNTVDMTADMLTKPLQGAVFVKHTFT